MQRLSIILGFLSTLLIAVLVYQPLTHAQAEPSMTDDHIARIRENCVSAQSTMDQMSRNSDTPLRINLVQLYSFITSKLMVPLDNRLALSGYDTVRQVTIVNNFQKEIDQFKVDYQSYHDALTKAISIQCTNEPVSFYDSVTDARAKRLKVHDTISRINGHLNDYKTVFEQVATDYKEPQ